MPKTPAPHAPPPPAPAQPLFLPQGAQIEQLDRELHELAQTFSAKATTARLSARRARERGNLVQWRKANAVAAAYNDARRALWGLACPF